MGNPRRNEGVTRVARVSVSGVDPASISTIPHCGMSVTVWLYD